MAKNKGLGMGLESLFTENETEGRKPLSLRITEVFPNKNQPRTDFDDEALEALAESIRQHGILQPILVRPYDGAYQIIAGERRWRAARLAGFEEIPVVIKELDDIKTAEIALVENLQRENLNPIEEALGYKQLMETCNYTQEEAAKVVGKSRSAVANSLRLLALDPSTMEMVKNGEISVGHAKILVGVEDPALRADLALRVKRDTLTVRNLEELLKTLSKPKPEVKPKKKDVYFKEIELSLAETTGRKVNVNGKNGKGKLEIEFYSNEDLAEIAKLLAKLNG